MERNEAALQPRDARTAAASVPLEQRVCRKETRGEKGRDRRKRGGEAGEKKSTKQAPGRYSEAKNVLKTTC